MTAAADDHRATAARFGELVAGTTDWEAPAPCEGWTARDVVRHLVEWLPGFLQGGSGIELPPGPSVDDDPVGAWRSHAAAVQAVLDDPATAGIMLANRFIGEMPVPDAITTFYTSDVFLHTWDLARATGQDERLDPQRCAAMLEGMVDAEEAMRGSGHYGPAVEVPADADPQTRLLAFIGRHP
jgi:uncharacterized protein (TIGR03086 family)